MNNRNARVENLKSFNQRIDKLFVTANNIALDKKELPIKREKPFEWFLTTTGDYALEYTLFVYLEAVPNTKITGLARKHLLSSLFAINSIVLEAAAIIGVELKTPDLVSFTQSSLETSHQC